MAEAGDGGADKDQDVDALTFEQLLDELERTIDRMANGALGIEEVTDLYERAGKLHDAATRRLASVQERIESLTKRATVD